MSLCSVGHDGVVRTWKFENVLITFFLLNNLANREKYEKMHRT
jgi:hypothetical protein